MAAKLIKNRGPFIFQDTKISNSGSKTRGAKALLFLAPLYILNVIVCYEQVDLVIHTYSNRYGTLLGNSQQDREEFKLNDNTEPLWGVLNIKNAQYVNHLYNQLDKVSHRLSRGVVFSN